MSWAERRRREERRDRCEERSREMECEMKERERERVKEEEEGRFEKKGRRGAKKIKSSKVQWRGRGTSEAQAGG